MPSDPLIAKRYFYEAKLIASEVGRDVAFLNKTSCMSPEVREMIACCEMYKIMFPEDQEFIEFLDKMAVPCLEKQGFASWHRDILTDMGLREAKKERRGSLKDLRKK